MSAFLLFEYKPFRPASTFHMTPPVIGGYVYHVLNGANARVQIFDEEKDYQLNKRLLTPLSGHMLL